MCYAVRFDGLYTSAGGEGLTDIGQRRPGNAGCELASLGFFHFTYQVVFLAPPSVYFPTSPLSFYLPWNCLYCSYFRSVLTQKHLDTLSTFNTLKNEIRHKVAREKNKRNGESGEWRAERESTPLRLPGWTSLSPYRIKMQWSQST